MNYIKTTILGLFISVGSLKAQFKTVTYKKKVDSTKNKIDNFQQTVEHKADSKEQKVRKKKKNKKELQK